MALLPYAGRIWRLSWTEQWSPREAGYFTDQQDLTQSLPLTAPVTEVAVIPSDWAVSEACTFFLPAQEA